MSNRMILCSNPECQTPAGCKCGWEMGEVKRWPVQTYHTILDLRAAVASLTAERIGLETELREQQNRHIEALLTFANEIAQARRDYDAIGRQLKEAQEKGE